jgi:quercetin 2,3-dioxygenase
MFLTDERGLSQNGWYRSYITFNFKKYQHAHKAPFSNLYVLNDDTIAAGKNISQKIEEDTDIILIPIVGSISYKDSMGNKGIIEPGEVLILDMPANTRIKITNPYENELVNFLQLWVKTPGKTNYAHPQMSRFSLTLNKNQLAEIFKQAGATAYMGQFDGRAETSYQLINASNNLFAFVIDGAFEMGGRLLHPRDGLVLWDIEEAEMEALSNNAIILIIEIPGL